MIQMNLLIRYSNGNIVQGPRQIDTNTDIGNEGLKRYHEGILDIAKNSIRSIPVKKREISGVTFAMTKKSLPKAKQLITRFQRELVEILEDESFGDEVFHLEVALVPLTKPIVNGE